MADIAAQLGSFRQFVRTEVASAAQKTIQQTAAFGRLVVIERTLSGRDIEGEVFRYYSREWAAYRKKKHKPIDHVYLLFDAIMMPTSYMSLEKTLFGFEVKTKFSDREQRQKAWANQAPRALDRPFWAYGVSSPEIVEFAQMKFSQETEK